MVRPLYRLLLRLYQRLPTRARRWLVRAANPKYTVGAICLIERSDGALLLVRHAYRGRWGFPGGLVKRQEDAADAARREVREEVGLDVELISGPTVVVEPRPQRVDVLFRARVPDGVDPASARPVSAEIVEARWFPPDALPELQAEAATGLMAVARSLGWSGAASAQLGQRPQVPGQAGVSELRERLGLDLPDSLASEREARPDLFEGHRA